MSSEVEVRFADGLAALGIKIGQHQVVQLFKFAKLVLHHNRFTNLTGARTLEALLGEQVLDSLSILSITELAEPVLDLGSGAGLPGIPLAIVRPSSEVILLEPRAKRAEFLGLAAATLRLANVSVVKASAAGPGANALLGKAGTVLMRAVAEPLEAMRLGAPFVGKKGKLVLYEGRASKATKAQLETARHLALLPPRVSRVEVPGLAARRNIWIFKRAT